MRRGLIVAAASALLCVASASADVPRPPVTWSPTPPRNYTRAHRTPESHTITTIVIHATDGGTLDGNVWWLSGAKSHVSAHYVIDRNGTIVQVVPLTDIAWHAGNGAVNAHSIGIEHVGDTTNPAGFTVAQYRASARLVAWLTQRYGIPVDRKHIIGHYQVPDPNDPLLFGGSDHHTDPGPYWRWGYYMSLVRRFAFPQRYLLSVRTTSFRAGTTLSGVVPWRAHTSGAVARRVDFSVDGRMLWSDARRPFAFAGGHGWNTTRLPNGTHVLTVRAIGPTGTATQRLVVRVANRAFALTTEGVRPWQKVSGALKIRADVHGARSHGIELYVDGRAVSRDRKAPYVLWWNSKRVRNGRHRLALVSTSTDGRTASRHLPVVVSNHPRKLVHPQVPAPHVTAENLTNGQVVAGVVDWRAHTIGAVARVDFAVDGVVIASSTREPWQAAWDTSTTTPGQHTLEVRAYTRDGQRDVRTVTVTVQAPAAG